MHTIHIDWRNGTSMTTFWRPYYIYVVFHYRYDDIMCSIRTCSHLVMTSYNMFALFYNLYIFLGLIYMMINMHLTMDAHAWMPNASCPDLFDHYLICSIYRLLSLKSKFTPLRFNSKVLNHLFANLSAPSHTVPNPHDFSRGSFLRPWRRTS